MESKTSRTPNNGEGTTIEDKDEYREAIRRQLNDEVKKIVDLEMQNAAQQLIEEHKKSIRQVVEEYRNAIRQVVEEEKKDIWKKAETFKKSMLKLGL